MKKLKILLYILLGLFLTLIAVTYFFLKSDSPNYEGNKVLTGLNSDVELWYDDYGIPHIFADNADDAYYSLGFAHGRERLFQIELIKRLTSGRMAEILGPDLLESDKFFRTLGLRTIAEKSAAQYMSGQSEAYQQMANAYLKGINHFIENGSTPLEFKILGIKKEKYTAADMYTLVTYMSLGFSNGIKEEPVLTYLRANFGEEYLKDWWFHDKLNQDSSSLGQLNIIQDEWLKIKSSSDYLNDIDLSIFHGSNAWVVSEQKSKSGKVLFANDTHIGFSQPSVWYEAHINYPGHDFYGNFLAGVPFGIIGHNQTTAWGITINPIDNLDLYAEKLNPENNNQVWENDHWVNLKSRKEVIKVKGEQAINIDVKSSRHGPIINNVFPDAYSKENHQSQKPISLSWSVINMTSQFLETIYAFNYSKGIDDSRAAASLIDIIGLNIMYGDVDGNIAWWASGKVPKRPDHVNSYYILDGASGKDEMLGYYSFSENAHEENPERGYVSNANNDPSLYDFDFVNGYYCPPNRIYRINKLLDERNKFSLDDLKNIQADIISDEDYRLKNIITASIENKLSQEQLNENKTHIETLKKWNGNYELNSIAAVIYTKVYFHILDKTMRDEIGDKNFKTIKETFTFKSTGPFILDNKNSPWWDDINTENITETRDDIIKTAFLQSITELNQQLGTDISKWQWANVHTLTHIHPIGRKAPLDKLFNVGPISIVGSNGVPNKQQFAINGNGTYDVTSGPALRILIDFANIENSISINPTGQSGHVLSPHYADQAEMYANNIYRKQLMNKAEIKKSGSLMTLKSK